jgi:hypothetical protein
MTGSNNCLAPESGLAFAKNETVPLLALEDRVI